MISFRCLYKFSRIQTLHSTCRHVSHETCSNRTTSPGPNSLGYGPNINSPTKPQTFSCSIRSAKSGIQLLNGFKPWIGGIKLRTNKPTKHATNRLTQLPGCLDRQKAMMLAPNRHKALAGPNRELLLSQLAQVKIWWALNPTLSPTRMPRGELSTASCSLLITTRPARFQCSNQTGTKVLRITH